jgi:uncharacterized membrane protein
MYNIRKYKPMIGGPYMVKIRIQPLVKIMIILMILMLLGASLIGAVNGLIENDPTTFQPKSYDLKSERSDLELDIYNFNDLEIEKTDNLKNELAMSNPNSIKIFENVITFPPFTVKTEDEYSRVDIGDLTKVGQIGNPELSIKTLTFKFKPGTTIKEVRFIPGEIKTEPLALPINPVQEPIPVSEIIDMYSYGEPAPTPPNPVIYGSSELFPNSWFKTDRGMGLDFDTGMTTLFFNVRIYPVRYLPMQNELIHISEGKLLLEYELPNEDISNIDAKLQTTGAADPQPLNEHYRLLIIGPENFRQNLTRLATYKNKTGIPAKFVSLTEINSGKYFTTQGDDQQEKIKYFIFNARKSWNITYVILGADTPLIPHRNAYIPSEEGNIPSDLYYSDLFDSNMQFCDWDYNDDGTYGEYSSGNVDRADLYSDVIIGRLPASTQNEMEVLVDKIINYESFTSGQPWFDNVSMSGTDTFSSSTGDVPEGEYACEYIDNNFLQDFNTIKLYETTTYERDLPCTSINIASTLNKGAGFATFHDHGAPTSWAGKFSNSNALSLTNGDMLPFMNFDACSTGYFDRSSGDSLTEVVVLNSKGGAIASVGASRLGYGQWDSAHITRYSGYFNTHLYDNYYNGEGTAGRIVESSKYDYLDNIPINSFADFKTIVEFVLFGDPSLSVGGIPLQNINISCENNQSYIDPAGSVEYFIKITNNGTFGRPIKLYLSGVPDQWSAYLNESLVIVPAMDEYEIKLIVNASETAVFKELANIQVYAFFSKNKDRTISVITKSITTRKYGLDLNTTQLMDSVYPGEEASFWFRVYNQGNAEDSIDLNASMMISNPGWAFNFSQSELVLPPFGNQLITLKVSIPEQTLFGSYEINVTSEVVDLIGDKPKDNVMVKINILRTYGLEFNTDDDLSKILLPGENYTYDINIKNKGNYFDKFQLTMLMYPPTWNISLSNTKQFQIDAFSEVSENLYFEIPEETLVGKYLLKVRAQSIGNYSILENILFEIRINRTYGFNVSVDIDHVYGNPGDIRDFNLTLFHFGNDNDIIKLNVINLPGTWYSNITEELSLEPFKEYTIPFQISSYIYAMNNTYKFEIEITLMGNLGKVRLGINYTVNPVNGFEFSCNKDYFKVDVGGSQRFSFFLKNLGNHEDVFQFNLTNLPDNWTAEWTPESLNDGTYTLDSYKETSTLILKITCHSNAIAKQYPMEISAKILSTGEVITSEIILEVKPFYLISLDMDIEDSLISVQPGEEFSISINLTNNGNGNDNITRLLLGIPENWNIRAPRNYTFNLEPYQKRKEIIRFEVPVNEYERDINLTITTNSDGDPNLKEVERSTIIVEFERLDTEPDESFDFTNFDQVFEQAFFLTICLPIIVLIIAVLIVSIILIRQRRRYKAEMKDLDNIARFDDSDEYYDQGYDEEAERLYGSLGATPKGKRTPPPPPGYKGSDRAHDQGKEMGTGKGTMNWIDDEQDMDSVSRKKYKKTHKSKKYLRKSAARDDMEDTNTICPSCGEYVSMDIDVCPYCNEQFGDVDRDLRYEEDIEDWDDEEQGQRKSEYNDIDTDYEEDEDFDDEESEEWEDDEEDEYEEFELDEDDTYSDEFEDDDEEGDIDLDVDWE